MQTRPDISIVIPAYNEASRIGVHLQSITEYFLPRSLSYEVLVVDDGSTDATQDVVKRFSSINPNIQLLSYGENRGKGYAVRFGMQHAKGAHHLFTDADGSVSIDHIDTFLAHAKNGADIVIGSIELPGTEVTERNAWYRRILGSASKLLIRAVAVPGIHDTQRGFKLFRAQASNDIFGRQTIERFGFDIELLLIARKFGYQIVELPVAWDNPAGSTVGLSSYARTLVELAQIVTRSLRGQYEPYDRGLAFQVEST